MQIQQLHQQLRQAQHDAEMNSQLVEDGPMRKRQNSRKSFKNKLNVNVNSRRETVKS